MKGISHFGQPDGYVKPTTRLCWEGRVAERELATYGLDIGPAFLAGYNYKPKPSDGLIRHRANVAAAKAARRERQAAQ